MSNNCGVYILISPTKKRYVGSSKDLSKRRNRYKNHSCSRQSAIKSSLDKYGFSNHIFKILMYCEEKELLFWERVFGDIYLSHHSFPNGLNIILPGYGDVPQIRSKEFNNRVSMAQKERFSKQENRDIISIKTKQALNSPVINEKIRIAQKKRYDNPEERIKRSEARKNYYKTNENAKILAREKTLAAYEKNPQLIEIARKTFKKYYEENPEARLRCEKKIINVETGEILKGISCILGIVNVSRKVMQNRLSGKAKNLTPYRWYNG